MRLDKWLWAARFYKTRTQAQAAIDGGHVKLNGERAKPAKEIRPGDRLELAIGGLGWSVEVRALSERRGPASAAQRLYEESEASRAARAARIETNNLMREPEAARRGRPAKKDRRQLNRLRGW
ncbi:MAG: RNA-binding S4 domain-containing protein [Betaproteobacteria bacterium]|nr:RNA-binding S4 domain-containing protein [Betaproteobacteria bacterium]